MADSVLIDTNLLVLLCEMIGSGSKLYSTPHVLEEVSNLTDLKDRERDQARRLLKDVIHQVEEIPITSAKSGLMISTYTMHSVA